MRRLIRSSLFSTKRLIGFGKYGFGTTNAVSANGVKKVFSKTNSFLVNGVRQATIGVGAYNQPTFESIAYKGFDHVLGNDLQTKPVHVNSQSAFSLIYDAGYFDVVLNYFVDAVYKKYGIDLKQYVREMARVDDLIMKAKFYLLFNAKVNVNFHFVGTGDEDKDLNVILDRSTFKTDVKKYDEKVFLDSAYRYLNEDPPDTVQCSEKIWGSIAFTIKEYYAKRGIAIKSHNGIAALCHFAVPFHADGEVISTLTLAFKNGEIGHRAFYEGGLSKKELLDNWEGIEEFICQFPKIPSNKVKDAIQPYLTGRKSTAYNKSLKKVTFEKINVTEKLFDKDYHFEYKCF